MKSGVIRRSKVQIYEILDRNYEIKSRNYEILGNEYGIKTRNWDAKS